VRGFSAYGFYGRPSWVRVLGVKSLRITLTVLVASGVLSSCAATASQAAQASSCSGSLSAKGTDVAVATPDPYASDVACRVLLDGGTAADAVAAAQFTLGLTEPQSSGPGGGAVAVYYDADSDEVTTWNATVPAPEDGTTVTGVPQTPRLMVSLQEKYGEKAFGDLLEPASELATEGFRTSPRLAGAVKRRHDVISDVPWPEVASGGLPQKGDTLTNPRYAEYLDTFTASGGPGGLRPEEPLCTGFRDHEVCGSGSTGTGTMVVGETLGILEGLESLDDHVVTEAERLALANGNTWMQDPEVDPDLSEAYVDSLVTDPGHLAAQGRRIDPDSTLGTIEPSPLRGHSGTYLPNAEEGTSQITVRDAAGSVASVTSTLHQHFGSGEVVDGYFLNNSLENFSSSSKATNQREVGVRPKTAMSPVIVMRDGSPVLAVGSPGGGSIPSYVVKTLVGILDRGLTARQAVDADNYGATGRDATYVEGDGGGRDSALSVVTVEDGVVRAEADDRADGAARAS
jgi:gamma-glutamyltranspeptidase/glutathione hydrolase